tara:strand:- start:540 stop:1169 length:630 start_codon:yes stop_codon:yes gene_type:complete
MKAQIKVPESLEEITLKQYQKWLKISEGKELDSFLQQKMIEIFCNVPLKQVLTIKMNYVNKICTAIDELFKKQPMFIDRFKYKGVQYGFIPKLDDITFGEYVDLDTYLADWNLMHKAMSVLYRRINFEKDKEYIIDPYESAEAYDLQNITLDIVFGALVFFYNLSNELQLRILNYLATQEEVDLPQDLRASVLNGVGINPSMDYARGIL